MLENTREGLNQRFRKKMRSSSISALSVITLTLIMMCPRCDAFRVQQGSAAVVEMNVKLLIRKQSETHRVQSSTDSRAIYRIVGGRCVRSHDGHRSIMRLHLAPQQLGSFEKLIDDTDDKTMAQFRKERKVWLYDFVSSSKALPNERPIPSPTIPYHEAWELQKQLVDHQLARIGRRPVDSPLYSQFIPPHFENDNDFAHSISNTRDGIATSQSWIGCDSIILLQHDPVYTLGTASDPSFILTNNTDQDEKKNQSTIPIIRIERGGEVTYHGPGQLTVYPILDLRGYKQDVHWYMRALEEVILLSLEKAGVKGAVREENVTGVWINNKKIAALGIKARRWVTMHGLAINVDLRSLQNFEGIVPCGLEGREVTCINAENSPGFTVEEFSHHLKEALEEIFCVTLTPAIDRTSLTLR